MQDGAGGGGGGGIHLLLTILADGEDQARRLADLPDDDDPPRLGAERYRGAARRLQCTLGKAVSVARTIVVEAAASRGAADSPRSADESYGGTAAVEAREERRQGVCKRRKGLARWTAKFRVADASLEAATPDDGFSWRKYGQKDILGAKFPRGYYRCTYRGAQGCLATKQVQRSDSDLRVFDVTYQGAHTCHQKQRHAVAAASPQPPPQEKQDSGTELLAGFTDCLKVAEMETTITTEAPLHASCGNRSVPVPVPSVMNNGVCKSTPSSHGGVAPADDTVAAAFSSSSAGSSSYYGGAVPHRLVPAGSYYDDHYSYYDVLPAAGCAGSGELGEVVFSGTTTTTTAAAAADLSGAGSDYCSLYQYHRGEFVPHLPFPPPGAPHC